jgi:hypothetical protein
MKKLSIGSYLNILAAVAAVVGLVATILCSTKTHAYALSSLNMIVLGAIVGILLLALAVWSSAKRGNDDLISAGSVLAAIGILSAIIGDIIIERIILISGLYSYNSGNTMGWSVFYITVVAIVSFVVSILLMIVGSFLKSVRE